MTKAWEREKAYTAKRAALLKEEMINAIRVCDKERFYKAYQISMRYMDVKTRRQLFIAFASHMMN